MKIRKPSTTIIVINPYGGVYGAERSLLALLQWLRIEIPGIRYVIMCPPGDLAEKARSRGFRVLEFECLRRHRRPANVLDWLPIVCRFVSANIRILQVLLQQHAGVVHANGISALPHVIATRILLRTPVLWHIRDTQPTGLIPAMLSRHVPTVAVSPKPSPCHGRGFGGRILTALNPLTGPAEPSAWYKPRISSVPIYRIGIVGQLIPRKRVIEAVLALAPYVRKHKELELHIVGDSPEPSDRWYVDNLRQSIRSRYAAASGRIHVRGYTGDPFALYRELDAVVLASRAELFGRAPLEAMLTGCLAIVSKTAGVSELLKHRRNALLFNPDCPTDLRRQVEFAFSNPFESSQIRDCGQAIALEYLSQQRSWVRVVARLHRQLLRESRRRGVVWRFASRSLITAG